MKQFLIVHSPNGRTEETFWHLKVNGIEPEIVECEQGNVPYVNILETVKKLIRENIEEEHIIIYEDDVRLYNGFSPKEFVAKLGGKFSMVSTGAFHVGESKLSGTEGVLVCSHYYGAQGVVYHKSSYPLILAINDDYIDTISRYAPNAGVAVPFLTYQKDYDEVNKDNQLIKREPKFKQENKRLMELINHMN